MTALKNGAQNGGLRNEFGFRFADQLIVVEAKKRKARQRER